MLLGKVGIAVATADDLATEHLEMITVAGKCLIGESLLQQIDQEGLDGLDDALADGDIAVLNSPEIGPIRQVRAKFVQGGASGRDNRALIHSPTFPTHATHPPAQCLSPLSGLRLRRRAP